MFQAKQLVNQFEVRTTVSPHSLSETVRRTIHDLLKNARVSRIKSLADQVDSKVVPERLIAMLTEFFGIFGAALVGVGLYGLLAYTVAHRTSELGIRMALGATAVDVTSLVLRDVLRMVAAGFLAGVLLVLLSQPLIVSLVQCLKPDTAVALAVSGPIIFAVAILATYLPVRGAIRVDPIIALRHE